MFGRFRIVKLNKVNLCNLLKNIFLPFITFCLCYGLLFYMHSQVAHEFFFKIGVSPLLWSFFDVSTFVFIGYILSCFGKKSRICWGLTFFLVLIVSFVNVTYSRYFGQYLPLAMAGNGDNLSIGAYLQYIIDCLKASDLVYLFSIVFFLISLYLDKLKMNVTKPIKWYCGVSCFFIGFILQITSLFNLIGHPHIPTKRDIDTNPFIPNYAQVMGGAISTVYKCGVARAQILYYLKNLFCETKLTDADRKEISEYLNDLSQNRPVDNDYSTERKNVVFILCETYLSVTSDLTMPDGKSVTPFLDSLRHAQDTFYNGNVVSNVKIGESADGQFIYMSGLLPLNNELSLPYFWGKEVPTWCRALKAKDKYTIAMTIPTDKTIWGQDKISPCYGVDFLFAAEETESHGDWMTDEQVFDNAMVNQNGLKKPFVHYILTVTNHSPYDYPKKETDKCPCSPKEFPENYTTDFINYLKDCHYMDHQIRRYFAYLKQSGAYDNTLIVIVSDHGMKEQYIQNNKSMYGNNLLPLFICNSGGGWVKDNVLSSKRLNQIDLYPTILDLMGINQQYRGLGCSIFSPHYHNTINEKLEKMSSDIIRGHYFDE